MAIESRSEPTDISVLSSLVRIRHGNAQEFGGTLRLDVPVDLDVPPARTIRLTMTLTNIETGVPTTVPARILASPDPEVATALMVADIAAVRLAYGAASGRWAIGLTGADRAATGFVATGDDVDLQAYLVYRGPNEFRKWAISTTWRSRIGAAATSLLARLRH
jgi:hypothetical protein